MIRHATTVAASTVSAAEPDQQTLAAPHCFCCYSSKFSDGLFAFEGKSVLTQPELQKLRSKNPLRYTQSPQFPPTSNRYCLV